LIADLGIDEVAIYNFGKGKLTVGNPAFMTIPPGSGPRHAAMHPGGKFFYVLNELSSNVIEFFYEAEMKRFTQVQTLSTLPDDFKGDNTGAEIEIHPSGKYVYTSNRGHDSIAVFSVNDPKRGTLSVVQHIPSGGKTPRQFEIDPSGHWLLAGNQGSDNIAIFSIDASTGKLTAEYRDFQHRWIDWKAHGRGDSSGRYETDLHQIHEVAVNWRSDAPRDRPR
jgi:6-phosphogluconolactonase